MTAEQRAALARKAAARALEEQIAMTSAVLDKKPGPGTEGSPEEELKA